MGIKSTRTLSRSLAIREIADTRAQLRNDPTNALTNEELGELLEDLRDQLAKQNRSTNFDNFLVVDDGEEFSEY